MEEYIYTKVMPATDDGYMTDYVYKHQHIYASQNITLCLYTLGKE